MFEVTVTYRQSRTQELPSLQNTQPTDAFALIELIVNHLLMMLRMIGIFNGGISKIRKIDTQLDK